jgi:hypothetical protein
MHEEMHMLHLIVPIIITSLVAAPHTNAPVCLAPASTQFASTNNAAASDAVTELFKSYLTGPTISATALTAKLASQAREEARRANCKFVLFVTVKQQRGRSGGALGQIAGQAAKEAAWGAAVEASTATKRVASMGAVGAARAATDIAATTKTHDELELSYRLESETGSVLKEAKSKQKAKSDGEDLLTPLIEHAAEEIAGIVVK